MTQNVKPLVQKDGDIQEFANDNLNLSGLPTDDTGLDPGDLWVDLTDGGALKVVPE